jgi:hypothetical protein
MYVAAAVAVVWSVGVSAQGRNFGGHWVVDAEKSAANRAAAPTMSAGGGVARGAGGGGGVATRTIITERPAATATAAVRGGAGGGGGRGGAAVGPMGVAIDAAAFTVTQGETATIYKLDGTPLVVESGSRRSTSRASWQGDKLVIQTTTEFDGNSTSSTTTWYLEGESLVRETATVSPSGESVPRKTYYKRA